MSVSLSEPACGTYGLLFCMKIVAKLIIGSRVIVGVYSSQYEENSLQNAVSVSLSEPALVYSMQCQSVCPSGVKLVREITREPLDL